jgi:hypothetical protein
MTGSADFTAEEWKIILEGPTSAGMIVLSAERGGTFREVLAIAKAYTEARQEHGDSALLDEIVSRKPEVDHARAHSPQELKEHGLQRIREAITLLEQKATPQELSDYRRFVSTLAQRVSLAKTKGNEQPASGAEGEAIEAIRGALEAPS